MIIPSIILEYALIRCILGITWILPSAGTKLGMGAVRAERRRLLPAGHCEAARCLRNHLHHYLCACDASSNARHPSVLCAKGPPRLNGRLARRVITSPTLHRLGSEHICSPMYSDVEFVLPQRGKAEPRKIYAARRLLRRVDYFDASTSISFRTMMSNPNSQFLAVFHSGFAESSAEIDALGDTSQTDDASVSDVGAFAFQFDDSDYEDDEDLESMSNDQDLPIDDIDLQETLTPDDVGQTSASATTMISNKRTSVSEDEVLEFNGQFGTDDIDDQGQSARNTRPKLSHPSTPRSRELALEQQEERSHLPPLRPLELHLSRKEPDVSGPKKARVVVRDVAYATYRAVLYYVSLF